MPTQRGQAPRQMVALQDSTEGKQIETSPPG